MSNAIRTAPLTLTRTPVTKNQFIQVRFYKEQYNEQEERNTKATGGSINPYALPIISVPVHTETNPTKAFLVPVLPGELIGVNQTVKEMGRECIDPLWMETPLSPTMILTIGREPGSTLCISHLAVSERHAEITYATGRYLLRDLGSRNGTFLNDNRLDPFSVHVINPGDKIRIGTVMDYILEIREVNRTEEAIQYSKNG